MSLPPDDLHARLAALREDGAWRFQPARWRALETLARRLEGQPEGVRRRLQERLAQGLQAHAEGLARAREDAAELARRITADHPAQVRAARSLQEAGDLAGLRRLALRSQAQVACLPLVQLNEHLRAAHPGAAAAPDYSLQAVDGDAPAQAKDTAQTGARPVRRPPSSAGKTAAQRSPMPVLGADELASARRFRRAWAATRAQDQVDSAVARRPAQAGPLNSHALVLESLALMRELSPDYLRHFMAQVETLLWLDRARTAYPAAAVRSGKARSTAKPAAKARRKA